MFKIFVITLFVGLAASDNSIYCESGLCRAGNPHIGCGHSGEFSASCPDDREMIHLTEDNRNAILKAHNSNRSRIASGAEPGFLPARRMATMTWSNELADLAELNVKQCQMVHDSCRNTKEFPYVGQNIAMRSRTDKFLPIEDTIEDVISGWYSEVRNAVQADIDTCCTSTSGAAIGHFTQIVTDRAIQVGCAFSRFTTYVAATNITWRDVLIACNYAFVNLVGEKVYVSGSTAAGCTTGVNRDHTGLCSVHEAIDPRP